MITALENHRAPNYEILMQDQRANFSRSDTDRLQRQRLVQQSGYVCGIELANPYRVFLFDKYYLWKVIRKEESLKSMIQRRKEEL